jgi:hypothetical protein
VYRPIGGGLWLISATIKEPEFYEADEKSILRELLFLEIQLLPELPMDYIASFLLSAVGTTCIYAGYWLFCDLPAMSGRGSRVNRAAVFLLNIVPGALLALSGAALLTTEARGILSHRPAVQRHAPAAEGTSWHPQSRTWFDRAA